MRTAQISFRTSVFMRVFQTRGDHCWQHIHKFLYPKDTCFRAHISNTRGDHFLVDTSIYYYYGEIKSSAMTCLSLAYKSPPGGSQTFAR